MKIELEKLIEILGGIPGGTINPSLVLETSLINFDSRKIVKGDIFVAITTEKQDGAAYINDAMDKGAVLAIAERNPDNANHVILVKDSVKALQDLGRYVRSQYKGFVLAVTGSSGKTTSKELIAHMLKNFGKTCYSEGSFNNHIGVPYNLCKLDFDTKYAVFELGMDHKGEISALVDLVRPNLAAITNVYPMHMEFFKEFKEIAEAKAEIFEKLTPYNNRTVSVINMDSNFASEVLIPSAKKHGSNDIITYGKKGQIKLKNFYINKDGKTDVIIEIQGKVYYHSDLGLGERYAYNANLAAAVAYAMNLDVVKAIDSIADFSPLKGRGKVSSVKVGKGFDIKLIDDSYNGQPEAMCYALSTLNDIPKGISRKIAILGRMGELGSITQAEHQRVGQAAANTDIDIIIGVGEETKFILSEIGEEKTKIFKANTEGLYNELIGSILQPNDIVLIKGSHYGSRVFEIADKLLGL